MPLDVIDGGAQLSLGQPPALPSGNLCVARYEPDKLHSQHVAERLGKESASGTAGGQLGVNREDGSLELGVSQIVDGGQV
jgi:hypothetical protein